MTKSLRWDPHLKAGIPDPAGAVIDGEWVVAGPDILTVLDPGSAVPLARVQESMPSVVDQAVESAHRAFSAWSARSGVERGRVLLKIAQLLQRDKELFATLEAMDTGKPLSQARGDIDISSRYFEFYAGVADKIYGETLPQADASFAYTLREPYGVLAHITPWNAPLNQMSRGVAPSLAAGNTVVVKPSELTPLSTLLVARLFMEAGLPPGVCNVVPGLGPTVGAALAAHPLVKHVSFTGSVATGQSILRVAAEKVMPCNLELGGKSASVVFDDADLDAAAKAGALAVIRNSGQSCFATTRMLAHRSIHDELVARIGKALDGLSVGHALDDCDLGALASEAQLTRVSGFVDRARSEGATITVGGSRYPELSGYFFKPTLLSQVTAQMEVAQNEVFGPVQSVLKFEEEDEAIAIANGTAYGLAAGVFTRSVARAHRVASALQAGQVMVNRYPMGGVDTPFGGYKTSGIGREKGVESLRGYTQLKTVMIDLN